MALPVLYLSTWIATCNADFESPNLRNSETGYYAPGAKQLGRDDGGCRRGFAEGQSGLPNSTLILPHFNFKT